MVSIVILAAVVLLPLLAALVLRSNGAVAFLSVCLGSVLAGLVSTDVIDFVSGFTPLNADIAANWVHVALVALPLIISLFATRKSVGASKQLFNFIPALAAGLLLALFTVPVLPAGVKDMVTSNNFWDSLLNLETAVLLVGALATYVLFLSLHARRSEDDKKH